MSEFMYDKEKYIEEHEQIIFENNTDSSFGVETGIIFHKSGLYDVDINNNHVVVSKVNERKAIDEAYQKGFEAGQHEATTLEYQQGLNDAWETVRKLYNYWYGNDDIFGDETFCEFIFQHSASEVIDRIKAYEESQKADEIKVGDEVIPIDAIRRPFVVVSIENNVIHGFELTDGYMPRGCHRDETRWEKTGRHFPQVAELLKAMKEGAE